MGVAYKRAGGLYQDEIKAWAEALHVSFGRMAVLQCLYEISHVRLWPRVLGCTSGVRWFDDLGMVHVRTLDWPLENISHATRIFRFQRDKREFVTVGIAGFVGVLSGMLPGAYSATINWAPSSGNPSLKRIGPAFLLRRALDECDTYENAVTMLAHTPLAASVIYTVCGTERGQACVIERTQTEHSIHKSSDNGVVAATNHFVSPRLHACTRVKDEEFVSDSTERMNEMSKSLGKFSIGGSARQLGDILSRVENDFTCHKMVFVPATGDLAVWPILTSA